MEIKELETYLEENSKVKSIFMEKTMEFQQEKNAKKQPAKRLNEAKINRIVDKMWDQVLESIHNSIMKQMNGNINYLGDKWPQFIEDNEILDMLEESIESIEFGEE